MEAFRVLCVCLAVTCASGSLLEGLLSGVHDHVHTVANTVRHVVHGGGANRLHGTHGGHQHPHYQMNQGGQAPDVVNLVVVVRDEPDNPVQGHYNHRPNHHHGRPPYYGGHQGYGQHGFGNQNQGGGNYHHVYGHYGVDGGQQDYMNQNQHAYGNQHGNNNNQGYGQQSGHDCHNNQNQGQNPTHFGQANPNPESYDNQNNQNNEQKIPTHFSQTTTLKPSGYSEQSKPGFGKPTMLQPLNPITNDQKETSNEPDSGNDDPLFVALINNPNDYSVGDKDIKEPKRETQADDEDAIDVRFGGK